MQDATALAAAIASGQTTASQVMEAALNACTAQAALGAVVHLDATIGRAGAAQADRVQPEGARARGPFHGVPILMKDVGAVARGLSPGAGASAFRARGEVPQGDSDLTTRFRAAGLIPFGLSAVPPFGLALSTHPEGMPPARNPWDHARSPGGSSGGAAAAVAGGIVAMAHATDAAGSIRVPAACCGLAGLKPSRGAVPGGPAYANHLMGIASELVLARSVRDIATLLAHVQGRAHTPADGRGLRVAMALPARCDTAQTAATRAAAQALAEAGCTLSEIAAPDALGAEAHDVARNILSVSLAGWLASLGIHDSDVPPLAARVAAEGRALTGTQVFALTRDIARLSDAAQALFADVDAVLTPVLAHAPEGVDAFDLTRTDTSAHFAQMERFAPNAALANVAGLPAFALPFGMADGLPVGVQLWGPWGSDAALCHLAALIEARAPALQFPAPIAGLPA